ncbi:MAG: hypothetical protein KQI35_15155 [Bacteroidetes bacterium]|nr:hypothetical protein [Bacteroidota bacterium]
MFTLLMVIFFLPQVAVSQDDLSIFRSFGKLSRPEKWWAIGHLFIARKSFNLSNHALQTARALERNQTLDGDASGGQVDAFKHAYWMALLAQEINPEKALKLGMAHEKGNYLEYKKAKRKGIQNSHDAIASEMDLFNNQIGIEFGLQYPEAGREALKQFIIEPSSWEK